MKSIAHLPDKYNKHLLPLLLFIAIGITALLLFIPVLEWLTQKMSLANGYLHLFAIAGLISLAIYRTQRINRPIFQAQAIIHPTLMVWIPAIGFYLMNEANIGFNTLSAALLLIYLYGMAGHFLSRQDWAAMLLPMTLLILVLPFEHYLDIYLGFPLRLLSAEWTNSILQLLQIESMTVESILMIDNKAAIVDLDCSGIKSLWIGMIFYLLITWIERFKINGRWFIFALVYILLLVCANVVRITILVLLDTTFGQAGLAQALHQALGLLGFAVSSLIIWGLLHYLSSSQNTSITLPTVAKKPSKNYSLLLGLMLLVHLIALMLYQPFNDTKKQLATNTVPAPLLIRFPHQEVALSTQEKEFFVNNQATAKKYKITVNTSKQSLIASMVIVWSRAWKSHHIPENCYISQAYSISDKAVWNISPTLTIRHLALNKSFQHKVNSFSAVYWFQSKQKATPDYSSRVLDGLFNSQEEWAMISILWSKPITAQEAQPLIQSISQSLTFTSL